MSQESTNEILARMQTISLEDRYGNAPAGTLLWCQDRAARPAIVRLLPAEDDQPRRAVDLFPQREGFDGVSYTESEPYALREVAILTLHTCFELAEGQLEPALEKYLSLNETLNEEYDGIMGELDRIMGQEPEKE